jgi:hypothetical protein
MKYLLPLASILALSVTAAFSESTFTGSGDNSSWSDPANWQSGTVPLQGDDVTIDAIPSDGIILLDTGFPVSGVITEIASLTFASTLSGSALTIAPIFDEILSVGNITNTSTVAVTLSTYVYSGSDSTWEGNLNFGFVNLGTTVVTISGDTTSIVIDETIQGTSQLAFNIGDTAADYGRFVKGGTSNTTLLTLNNTSISLMLTGLYAPGAGDTFTLAFGFGLSDYNLDNLFLPTLEEGLSWDTTQFAAGGLLTVVPEPSTYALIALTALGLVVFRRRSRSC